MGVDLWVDWVTCPLLFEVERTPYVVFSLLFLGRKVEVKIVATRCHILRLIYTEFDFGWGSPQTPLEELTALFRFRAGFKGNGQTSTPHRIKTP